MAFSNVIQTRAGRMQFQGLFECVSEMEATWDPDSVNSNVTFSETVEVIGARLGDMVLVSLEADLQKVILSGYVSATDEATMMVHNSSSGAVNLGASTVHIIVLRPQHHHKV